MLIHEYGWRDDDPVNPGGWSNEHCKPGPVNPGSTIQSTSVNNTDYHFITIN